MKTPNPFRAAPKCPYCKDREDQHGEYGCLAPSGGKVCNCTKRRSELERERLAKPTGSPKHPRPPRRGGRVLRRLDRDHSPLNQEQ